MKVNQQKKTIGILGGMGPAATLQLAQQIMQETPAGCDQDHVPLLIHNNTQIPDRNTAILSGRGSEVLEKLLDSIRIIESNVDYIILPCNTAHYFYDQLSQSCNTPILHLMQETATEIKKNPSTTRLGLLATTATVNSKLYHKACSQLGLEIITPTPKSQDQVVHAITLIKAGLHTKARNILLRVAKQLQKRGADAIIGGCTEIPLVLESTNEMNVYDPSRIVARKAVWLSLNNSLNPEIEVQTAEAVCQ